MQAPEVLMYPAYLALYESGELARRAEQARQRLAACTLCAQACGTNRLDDETGNCGVGRYALVASASPHFGEEWVLRGRRGSGTVFFAGCNMSCVFCQNSDISHEHHGTVVSADQLANIFLALQRQGCHNLNLVTPSHVVAQVLEALVVAVPRGFRLPIVYNTAAYDALPALHLLDGVVDVYMPDMKYANSTTAARYSGIPAYWEMSTKAVREMQRQVGTLEIVDGLARRGLLIRHLVLPGDISGTSKVLHFIAEELSPDSWVNLMDQYYPAFRVAAFPALNRRINRQEYIDAVESGRQLGLHRGIPFSNAD